MIGTCPAGTLCLHCRQTGDVKRIVNAAEAGGKSETLHEDCAAEWFAKQTGGEKTGDQLVKEMVRKRERIEGPRDGDWVIMTDGSMARLTTNGICKISSWVH